MFRMEFLLLCSLVFFTSFCTSGQAEYDVLIRNGRVLDGTGNPWHLTDIASLQ
ncbi:MAG: hypothetical protein WD317_01260 [Balneolaceae bacterium]